MVEVDDQVRKEGFKKIEVAGTDRHYYARDDDNFGLRYYDEKLQLLDSWSINLEKSLKHLMKPLERSIRLARFSDERKRSHGINEETSDEIEMISFTFDHVMRAMINFSRQAEQFLGQRIFFEFPTSRSSAVDYDEGFIINARLASGKDEIVNLSSEVNKDDDGIPEDLSKLKETAEWINR